MLNVTRSFDERVYYINKCKMYIHISSTAPHKPSGKCIISQMYNMWNHCDNYRDILYAKIVE